MWPDYVSRAAAKHLAGERNQFGSCCGQTMNCPGIGLKTMIGNDGVVDARAARGDFSPQLSLAGGF
jgi:hypothetical protein